MLRASVLFFAFLCGLPLGVFGAETRTPSRPRAARIEVDPPEVRLVGPEARYTLLVTGRGTDGRQFDLTHSAVYRSLAPSIVAVNSSGVLRAKGDGVSAIEINVEGSQFRVPVQVSRSRVQRSLHFENDVLPILSRFGCNSSGCHGKAEGQNGFKLSIFGFDPHADRLALLEEGRGRRIFPAAPDQSLVLKKATGILPHGGGVRIARGSDEYRLLRDWIAAGAPEGDPHAPHVVSIRLSPRERRLRPHESQQLRVIARYSDGKEIDVTAHTKFQSNHDELVQVDGSGLVAAGDIPGEAAVMAAYMGAVDVFRALMPMENPWGPRPSPPPQLSPLDRIVDGKLASLDIVASPLCTDEEYVRRVFLDVIGTLPTPDEIRAYLADERPNRRQQLVEALLNRPEYAEYWALKWSDILRVDRRVLGYRQAYEYYAWIRDSFAQNKRYDRFVNELLSAEGVLAESPAGFFYKVEPDAGHLASTVSQVFLGVRIACAQCHHHPYDRWSQTDYYGMKAFFTQMTLKATPRGELLAALGTEPTRNPRTGEEVFAHVLGSDNPHRSPNGDRRRVLANWLTAPDNPWLARALVNRMWAHFLGRGIVEPVDDFRSTNPPSNPALLEALASDFIAHHYDVKSLIRTITASRTYQLSSEPNGTNLRDDQNYSRALLRRLDAEVLLDAVCQATGVGEKFRGVPRGPRAIELWDNESPHYFLKLFGRPVRATACECERSVEPSVSQALHVLNSPAIHAKLSDAGGTIASLVRRFDDDGALIDEIFLTFCARYPSAEERRAAIEYFRQGSGRRRGAEDLAWSLMNTVEFSFNH